MLAGQAQGRIAVGRGVDAGLPLCRRTSAAPASLENSARAGSAAARRRWAGIAIVVPRCGRAHFVPHSCRNRHCPLCQGQAGAAGWSSSRRRCLPVPYFHLVFTLPHELNPLIRQNQRALYQLLFERPARRCWSLAGTLPGADWGSRPCCTPGARPAGPLPPALHRHRRRLGRRRAALGRHVRPHYLFPVRRSAPVFRGKFCAGLQALYAAG